METTAGSSTEETFMATAEIVWNAVPNNLHLSGPAREKEARPGTGALRRTDDKLRASLSTPSRSSLGHFHLASGIDSVVLFVKIHCSRIVYREKGEKGELNYLLAGTRYVPARAASFFLVF